MVTIRKVNPTTRIFLREPLCSVSASSTLSTHKEQGLKPSTKPMMAVLRAAIPFSRLTCPINGRVMVCCVSTPISGSGSTADWDASSVATVQPRAAGRKPARPVHPGRVVARLRPTSAALGSSKVCMQGAFNLSFIIITKTDPITISDYGNRYAAGFKAQYLAELIEYFLVIVVVPDFIVDQGYLAVILQQGVQKRFFFLTMRTTVTPRKNRC